MILTPDQKAALMLTTQLTRPTFDHHAPPLSTPLFRQVQLSLSDARIPLHYLTDPDPSHHGAAYQALAETSLHVGLDQIKSRLHMGFLMAMAVTDWESKSIAIVSDGSDRYPQALSDQDEPHPPFLFILGDPDLERAHANGCTVRAVAKNLINDCTDRKVRNAVMERRLVLVSAASPYQRHSTIDQNRTAGLITDLFK